ncbi:hypothetical protein BDY19DRAFT_137487 [Irpex rosettiformis]|uniref:Uncharacterized protein n=1 Tax=Irpex rosettiformis TaxID=378272 RepID=A0ACB8U4Z1_9APHY|nr:hypothetical protein BDY19DRAFT_137487 [Irpex rosettiformis]
MSLGRLRLRSCCISQKPSLPPTLSLFFFITSLSGLSSTVGETGLSAPLAIIKMTSLSTEVWAPIFIGTIFNVMLYGIMILQTYLYFTVYKRDRIWMKAYVALLFVCDSINCAFAIALVYIPFIKQFGNQNALANATWLSAADPAMTGIIACFVQLFFAWRIKVLTGSWPLVLVIASFSITQMFGGLGTAIGMHTVPEYTEFQRLQVIVIIWLAASALTDTIITVSLVGYLGMHKTGFSSTDDSINRIIRLTVQTGMVTAVCAIVDLICFLVTPNGLHLAFNIPLSKLYTNSLMSSLNSRAGWGYDHTSSHKMPDRFGPANSRFTFRSDLGHDGGHSRAASKDLRQVVIDIETIEMTDPEDNNSTLSKVPHSPSERGLAV